MYSWAKERRWRSNERQRSAASSCRRGERIQRQNTWTQTETLGPGDACTWISGHSLSSEAFSIFIPSQSHHLWPPVARHASSVAGHSRLLAFEPQRTE
ncbi:uncharacterized protein J3R85_017097 [Psidium guajava]|nr:uncharacterized protein J3R85_017097 [Psidium guajava]